MGISWLYKNRGEQMRKNGYNTVELVVALAVFTLVYFVSAFVVSNNFKGNFEDDMYNQKISSIEKQAALYAKGTEDFFKENTTVYMTVEELALANAIISKSEGVVADPRNENDTLNALKVKISLDKEKVTAKVLG